MPLSGILTPSIFDVLFSEACEAEALSLLEQALADYFEAIHPFPGALGSLLSHLSNFPIARTFLFKRP